MCKPDSNGHKYCSVAIDTDIDFDNGTFCFAWDFVDGQYWNSNMNMTSLYTKTGKSLRAYDFNKDKPSLFAMTDFSYYTDDNGYSGSKSRLKDGRTVVLCGSGVGPGEKNGVEILEGELSLQIKALHIGTVKPFTHPSDKSMILFNSLDGEPLVRYNMKQNLLEYKPQLSESYIKELCSTTDSGKTFIDVNNNKCKSFVYTDVGNEK